VILLHICNKNVDKYYRTQINYPLVATEKKIP